MNDELRRPPITLHLEQADPAGDRLSVIVSGNTWSYRARLDAAKIPGGYSDTGGEKKAYFRVLRDVQLDHNGKQQIKDLISIFNGLALRVLIVDEAAAPPADSSVARFLEELRAMPQLHFKS